MDSFLKKECDLAFFDENGYIRKQCSACGAHFWTLDQTAMFCGDQPCVQFSFINKPLTKKPFSLSEVREQFLSYFEERNHARLWYPETGERCPVVARWRSDIYLTIASIADFQPHVTSGEVPPPSNPLVVSQPCIRLNDLEEIGVSGRHLSMFEMMGHHAFNKHTDEIYWKNKTVEYCDDFFVNRIGIPRKKITYKEQLWDGGGNAGPCLEVLAGGLEIATLVFMNMKEDDKGTFEINGKTYSPNPLNIVDTGYGLERIAWCSQGTPTVYETVSPEAIKWITDRAKNPSDMQSVYSLADHSKCLAFMLGDGIVPSNVKAGYLARLIIRRALRFMENIRLDAPLKQLVNLQLDALEKDFPSLKKRKKQIDEILDLETRRFRETLAKGENLIKRILKESGTISTEALINLYDTHGMPPDVVQKIAEEEGLTVHVPDNFDSMIAELHSKEKASEHEEVTPADLPSTEALYYTNHYIKEFDAKVLWEKKTNQGTKVVLNKTAFYPEGGGQPGDKGTLQIKGKTIPVTRVEKQGDAIIHLIDGNTAVGDSVHGTIDWNHRYTLMKHHTGTHLVNGALRQIFGEHIWQAGSQLGIAEARFDFSHYKPITEQEREVIETKANEFITKAVDVKKRVLDRNSAERQYGFRLYQGGVPPGNSIRVLDIPGIDVEACGGTHLNNTKEIEKIRILKTERIQDGVNRIIFAAGKMVDAYQQEEQQLYTQIVAVLRPAFEIATHEQISQQLQQSAALFKVPSKQLKKTIQRFLAETELKPEKTVVDLVTACEALFKEWKQTKKRLKKQSAAVDVANKQTSQKEWDISGKKICFITQDLDQGLDTVARAAELIKEKGYIVYISSGNRVTLAASEDVDIDLTSIAKQVGTILGGSGGGKPRMAHAGGKKRGSIADAQQKAEELIEQQLKKK